MFFFFFQAEDGIRDRNVTGVQTCALPRSRWACSARPPRRSIHSLVLVSCTWTPRATPGGRSCRALRSEERRVGKEGSHLRACAFDTMLIVGQVLTVI